MAKKKQVKSSRSRERAAARRRQQQTQTALWIAGGILILLALGLLLLRAKPDAGCGAQHVARMNQPLDDFQLKDLEGNTVHLSDYAGQTVLVNFWATWCPPCRAEMPALKDYYEAHKDEGFVILAVNAHESLSQVRQFAYTEMHLPFPVVLDEQACVINAFGISSFPTSIIVGSDGVVKKIHIGMLTPELLDSEITPLWQGQ